MTEEEVLEVLEKEKQYMLSHGGDRQAMALEMAIKALEQEPCEDAISRQAVDQNIYDYAESNGLSYANMKNYILDVPPVTPTRKKGHWIIHSNYDAMECDKCGRAYSEYDYNAFNYCPNCGAEMESKE